MLSTGSFFKIVSLNALNNVSPSTVGYLMERELHAPFGLLIDVRVLRRIFQSLCLDFLENLMNQSDTWHAH